MSSTKKPKRILNCIDSPKTENDWTFDTALAAGMVGLAPPPPNIDLRADWWQIGDQKSTGSCVGWATADSVLRWHFVKAGRLAPEETLSPRFVWMAAKESDEFKNRPATFIESDGTSLKAALDIARKYGAVKDALLPFTSGRLFQGDANTFYAVASQMKISSYFNLGRMLSRWKNWLANHGPILTRLNVDETWDNAKATLGHLEAYQPGTVRGGHAVALVGYTPDYFIVRNSWGTATWGDQGFAYASNNYAKTAFTEAYGVSL